MNLKQLYYFANLAETEHYTKSAELLGISQPTLSHMIKTLESELDVLLFEKDGRNIRLTKYGTIFLPYVQNSLHELEKGKRTLNNIIDPKFGTVELAFIYTMGASFVPEMVHQFSAQEAHQNVTFNFHQGTTHDVIPKIYDESCDLAICSFVPNLPELSFVPVHQEELVLITAKNHPLANYDSLSLKQTMPYPYVFFSKKSGLYPLIDQTMQSLKIHPKIACVVEEDLAMAGLVSNNYGIAIIPKINALSSFDLKIINIADNIPARIIYLAFLKNRYIHPAAKAFISFLMQRKITHDNN
jgi:DNA-binding transcriptional LysR family regulator